MALYFYFNETTGDLVYSDQETYDAEGYTSLGEQTNMDPGAPSVWVFDSKRESIKTVTKDPAISGKIAGLTRMSSMFDACFYLTSIDLSGFDTSKATYMGSMFSNCLALTSLDLSGFDTSKVENMGSMFQDCSSITSLDLSGFDTSKVTNMFGMFNGCSALKTLDLSGFDTSKATTTANMFTGCALDVVRCRPKQFLEHAVPTADETPAGFIIPSSSGSWYDFKGTEVTDFSSDAATTLYSDPSKAPDGSKLVNLQDLKAALESHGGSGLPLAFGDVLYQGTEEDPGCVMAIKRGDNVGIGISNSDNFLSTQHAITSIVEGVGLDIGVTDHDGILHYLSIGFINGNPGIFIDEVLLDPAIDPYGFARYATDQDFEDYVFAED